ncbi:hypothetical protein BJL85_17420 [Vibrio parahaemolyticus]|uniref:hypothetical protein n=1 Tax=Vibrio harveyi group TaxID=717610 RepID=UPI00099892E0|nr:hypothetical protein [Vibrio parahaemolyticus]ELB2877500.1 hypothetical protein [Vibrio parahaemolyticus]MBM4904856.1 hypothetical protein [Vibrio parahaemolyticus]OOX29094.1 hypothetical protein BJL85_17420 [Vibrio parahaemolyticus]
MARRPTVNRTQIPRIKGLITHSVYCSYTCVKCQTRCYEELGKIENLPTPKEAFENFRWKCQHCGFVHAKGEALPFTDFGWAEEFCAADSLSAERFWLAFFRGATTQEAYWKACHTCGRILPEHDFAKHSKWGALEKQLECKTCKAAINADQLKKRTKDQLRESSSKRRIAELLTKQADEKLDVDALFERFEGKCFKTGVAIDREDSKSWNIDHTMPSRYFWPLNTSNATLLSATENAKKSDKWPSEYYNNDELYHLSEITGAKLELLASKEPIFNQDIDVDLCVERYIGKMRRGTDMQKRTRELKALLELHGLEAKLSDINKKRLGYE